ncbi:MAG TPA: HNH endonuclease [Clostridiales bacterium]|nr:HNH endonuclease [Clostridiales bacterium]
MQHKYTDEQRELITLNYLGKGNAELPAMFNAQFGLELKISQIKAYKNRHKLNSGLNGRFKPGSIPPNKGVKGVHVKGTEKTWFKKGSKPPNWVPIGSERITKDGYIQIKIQEGKFQHNWRGKHILIWEEHNGQLPKGHAILFGDGDKRNFSPDNLILVSRAQLARLNQNNLIQKDADLTRTALIIVDLKDKISEKIKKI